MENQNEIYYTTQERIVIKKSAVAEISAKNNSIRLSGGLYLNGIKLTGEIPKKDIPDDCTIIN